MKTLLLLIAVCFALPASAQPFLKGSVKDANGNVPIGANIHLSKIGDQKFETYNVNKDGSFSIQLPREDNYLQLRVSAVNHQEISIPLLAIFGDKQIVVDIQLQPNPYVETFEKVRIIGDWNNFKFSGTDTMARVGNMYTYTRTADGDTMSYQLLDIAGGRSVNGTHADYFAYDGGGDYRSVIRTTKGQSVTISFEPEKIVYPKSAAKVEFKGNEFLANIYNIHAKTADMNAKARVVSANGMVTMDAAKYREVIEYLRTELEKVTDKHVREFAAVTLAEQVNPSVPFDKALAQSILDAVPPTSPLWAMSPMSAGAICQLVGKEATASYENELAEKNPSRTVRAITYANRLAEAYQTNQTEKAKTLFAMLKQDYTDVAEVKYFLMQFNPDAAVQVGKKVPEFELDLIGTTTKVSNTSMLGKYYLIDFWATWCGPCVREMPAIHKAYERFKGRKGFEILSISMDGSEAQIAPFRKKWAMPWQHVFIPGIFDNDVAQRFEVAGIPKPILVDGTGAVVAMQEALRGETLEATLEKFLGGEN